MADLEKLLSELDEESLDKLNYDDVLEMRKKLNPYGRTIEGQGNYLTFSFINLQEKYMEKLLFTGLIGFLNHACDIYKVPENIPVIPVYEYLKNPDLLQDFHRDWKMTEKIERDIKENEEAMAKRVIIKEFLESLFQFNPDEHVRSVYRPCPKDIDREILETPAANISVEMLKKRDIQFRKEMLEYDRALHLREMSMKDSKIYKETEPLVSRKLLLPDLHYSKVRFGDWKKKDLNLLRSVCEMIPPHDIFRNFRNYYETNYDKLREAVLHLYCDKPEFDIAINPYQWHESDDSAVEFQQKHKDEVIADIHKAVSGKWNLLAPFAKVRETAKYFNKNTAVLEEIMKQQEMDAKLGADIMRKRIKKKKRKNIQEEGPDSEAFRKWRAENSTLKDMGVEEIKEDEEDDGVKVDVFRIKDGKLQKSHFYTQAEDPKVPN
jgi:hypothetical protein